MQYFLGILSRFGGFGLLQATFDNELVDFFQKTRELTGIFFTNSKIEIKCLAKDSFKNICMTVI